MRKTYRKYPRFKSYATGEVEAVFATMRSWDKDNDYTESGAFGNQEVILEGWNHNYGLPVGKGSIYESGDDAIFSGKFFLDTVPGKDHFETVRRVMPEWSYTFNVLQSKKANHAGSPGNRLIKLDVIGVSPVTRGAGINTRTLLIKRWQPNLLARIDAAGARLALMRIENILARQPKKDLKKTIEYHWHKMLDYELENIERLINEG